MEKEEAIFCEKSYMGETDCVDCKYYATDTCKSRETHKMAVKALEQYCEDAGELSDGYHTFNQLYHQRAVLFASIVKQNKNKAWKSFKHSDGKYCFDSNGEWFIVGIDTPQGSYTYHYAKEYWDMFDCQKLECGKEWDGHTEEDVTRLLSLEQQPCDDCISREQTLKAFAEKCGGECACCEYNGSGNDTAENCKLIKSMPSVTPSRPEGKWIDDNCSICGYGVEPWNNTPYCPNCGADMRESEE